MFAQRAELRADPTLACVHLPYGVGEFRAYGVLEEISSCPRKHGAKCFHVSSIRSKYEDLCFRKLVYDFLNGFRPPHHGHAKVHQHDVGPMNSILLDRRNTVIRFPFNRHIRLVSDDRDDSFPK